MNSNVILALLSDLYGQVVQLTEENRQLREALEQQDQGAPKANGKAQETARTRA
ncbi:MAG: hypothetical protein ACRD0P_34935 [Stackebrandtia sp.]